MIGDKKAVSINHAHLVRAGWPDLPDQQATSVIMDRARQCTNNPERRTVLTLWQDAAITQATPRKRLLTDVLLPLLDETNNGATELALEFLPHLATPIPQGMRSQISTAVEQATAGNEKLHKRALRVLTDLGYATHTTGWLHRRTTIRPEPDN